MVEEQKLERADRLNVMISATLVTQNGARHPVRVKNFSETGIGFVTDTPLAIADVVLIELRDSHVTGHIVRKHGKNYGISVTERIDVANLSKRPTSESVFVIRDLHQVSESTYRPRVTQPIR